MMEIHQSIVALEEMDQPLQDIIAMASHDGFEPDHGRPLRLAETVEANDPIGGLLAIRIKIKKIAKHLKTFKGHNN